MAAESPSHDSNLEAPKTPTKWGLGAPTRARNQGSGASSDKARHETGPSRSSLAAAKRRNYAALRARGVRSVRAVRQSGYRPGTRRAARSQALKLDRSIGLHDVDELGRALIRAGVDYDVVARTLKRSLENRRTSLEALSLLGKWMGWDRPRPAAEPNSLLGEIPSEDLILLRRNLQARIAEIQAAASFGDAAPMACASEGSYDQALE